MIPIEMEIINPTINEKIEVVAFQHIYIKMKIKFLLKIVQMKYLLPLLYISNSASYLRQLYGEWIVGHSNVPIFSSSNSKMVNIFPKKQIICKTFKSFGPFLYRIEYSGEFIIDCNEKECKLEDDNVCDISLIWNYKKSYVESFFGIGLNELFQKIKTEKMGNEYNVNITLNVLENNNLCLSTDNYHLDLIRSISPNDKNNNTPLSSFIATQIFGSILLHFLHNYFKDLL